MSGNSSGGIYVGSPAYPGLPTKPSLTTVAITGNTGFAISVDAKVTFTTATGLTVSGNTTNAAEIRGYATGGVVGDTDAQWKLLGASVPYVVTGSNLYVEKANSGAPTPILTIDPGVTVSFNSGTSLYVGYNYAGELHAGAVSPAAAATFTANGSTTPGFWNGIRLWTNATSGSYIKNAVIRYGGQANVSGGIYVNGCSPTLQALTVQNNAYAGISINGGATPITGSTISSNAWGVVIYGSSTASVSTSTVSTNTSGGIYVGSPAYPGLPTKPSLTTVTIRATQVRYQRGRKGHVHDSNGAHVTGNTRNAIEMRGYATGGRRWGYGRTVEVRSEVRSYVVTGSNLYVEKANSGRTHADPHDRPGRHGGIQRRDDSFRGVQLCGRVARWGGVARRRRSPLPLTAVPHPDSGTGSSSGRTRPAALTSRTPRSDTEASTMCLAASTLMAAHPPCRP